MAGGEDSQDEAPHLEPGFARPPDSDRMARPRNQNRKDRDGQLHGGQEDLAARDVERGLGKSEDPLSRMEDAAAGIWVAGRDRAKQNQFRGTRRPLVRLAEELADAHYFLANKRLRDRKRRYVLKSLVTALRTCYGLAVELERQIDVTRKDSKRFDAADDVVPPRSRTWRSRQGRPIREPWDD